MQEAAEKVRDGGGILPKRGIFFYFPPLRGYYWMILSCFFAAFAGRGRPFKHGRLTGRQGGPGVSPRKDFVFRLWYF
jgi:hypothetical protein